MTVPYMNVHKSKIYGKGYIDDMNIFISNYQYNLDLMGVVREHSGDNRDCAEQVAFNPSHKKPDDQQQQSYNITQFSNSRSQTTQCPSLFYCH